MDGSTPQRRRISTRLRKLLAILALLTLTVIPCALGEDAFSAYLDEHYLKDGWAMLSSTACGDAGAALLCGS